MTAQNRGWFTVRYWQSCNDVWWPSCPRLNPSHAGISRWSTAFIPHTVQPEKTEVFHLFCQINLRYQPIARQHPFSLFPNSNQMFYSVFFLYLNIFLCIYCQMSNIAMPFFKLCLNLNACIIFEYLLYLSLKHKSSRTFIVSWICSRYFYRLNFALGKHAKHESSFSFLYKLPLGHFFLFFVVSEWEPVSGCN